MKLRVSSKLWSPWQINLNNVKITNSNYKKLYEFVSITNHSLDVTSGLFEEKQDKSNSGARLKNYLRTDPSKLWLNFVTKSRSNYCPFLWMLQSPFQILFLKVFINESTPDHHMISLNEISIERVINIFSFNIAMFYFLDNVVYVALKMFPFPKKILVKGNTLLSPLF